MQVIMNLHISYNKDKEEKHYIYKEKVNGDKSEEQQQDMEAK